MNKKFLQIGVTVALLLVVMVPTPVLAKQTVDNKNTQVQQPTIRTVAPSWMFNISITFPNRHGGNTTIIIQIGWDVHATSNITNINVDGTSTALLGRPRGNNTVNTTIPSMKPGQTVYIKVPAEKGLALMEYNVNAHYQFNGTINQAQYGPDKYLLFFGFPINIRG